MRRDVFQAIADPVRREIIDMLAKETMTVNDVADKFQISRPAISKHIRILNECGIVKTVAHGRERHCVIIPEELKMVSSWVDQHRSLWEPKLDAFEAYLNTIKPKPEENERDDRYRKKDGNDQ